MLKKLCTKLGLQLNQVAALLSCATGNFRELDSILQSLGIDADMRMMRGIVTTMHFKVRNRDESAHLRIANNIKPLAKLFMSGTSFW